MLARKWAFYPVLILLAIVSCGKPDDVIPPPKPDPEPEPPTPVTGSYQQRLADTLFKLAQQVYYWNAQIPDSSTFKPWGYAQSDTLKGLNAELLAIARLTKNPDNANKPYEQAVYYNNQGVAVDDNSTAKYSYIVKTSDLYNGGAASSTISSQSQIAEMKMTLDGKDNDLGFSVGLVPVSNSAGTSVSIPYNNKDSVVIYVRYVTNGSPAYNAGLKRGDIIANKELDYNTKGAAPIENALNSNAVNLILYKPVTKTRDTLPVINKAVYTFNPVFRDTMITVGSKKIAYVAYQSFTYGTNSSAALDKSFAKFTDATDIVVDLRHNGGGSVTSAEYFIDLLAPASANNLVSFATHYTQTMVNKQATILKTQPVYLDNVKQNYTYYDFDYSVGNNTEKIEKKGNFNTSNKAKDIYFLVSSGTASASELVINSLKPYYNVYLIGARFSDYGYKTYGKPVGFFELRLGKYSTFLASFETKNAQGNGSYYDGLTTNFQAFDDVKYNFGDPNESCFKLAIQKITGNPAYSPASSARSVYSTNPSGIAIGPVAQIQDMIINPAQ